MAIDGTRLNVLLVEDDPADARLVRESLAVASSRFKVDHVERLGVALKKLEGGAFDVVLLDLSLPDTNGLETVAQVQAVDPKVPIVVLSGHSDDNLAIQAVHSGAQDFLVKGWGDADVLSRALRYAIERKQLQERLAYMAHFDDLTGLANRALFHDQLVSALNRAAHSRQLVALLFLDVDRFKLINDTMGHEAGDVLLKGVAERLIGCVRKGDTIGRIGGDEFTIILEGLAHGNDAAPIAQKILDVLAPPFLLDAREVFASGSIGIATYPTCATEADTLIKNADTAMYRAKELGRNNYQYFEPVMNTEALRRRQLYDDMRRAIDRNEFELHYQPTISLRNGAVIAVEALLRWRHPESSLIPPGNFIPFAEDSGLIVLIDALVLRAACAQAKEWTAMGLPPLRVFVNVSAQHFRASGLRDLVVRVLDDVGVEPHRLGLELTENVLVDNIDACRSELHALRSMGIEIAIDDFGTGYSSLTYLKRVPFDKLKMDRSFICDICADSDAAAIAAFVIDLAHLLGVTVVAEGVGTPGQAALLCARGCDAAQGFFYRRPLPAEALVEWLRQYQGSLALTTA